MIAVPLKMRLALPLTLLVLLVESGCGGPPCRAQDDCPLGFYCVLDVGGPGSLPEGECKQDCASFEDCEQPDNNISMAICTNEGRCRTQARPPRLTVLEPEIDQRYPEGTREIRISGEVESAASVVNILVTSSNKNGCGGGPSLSATVMNPTEGEFATLPFVIDGLILDPGISTLVVEASVGSVGRSIPIDVEIECPGCAEIDILEPKSRASAPGLELPRLSGTLHSPGIVAAIWRVHSLAGDVLDGSLPVGNGSFSLDRIPLFAGLNRVEVFVSGVGRGLGESRCSSMVSSSLARELGLRVVLMWDGGESDIDLHVIGPEGRFGDPATSLSARGRRPYFGGTISDDSMGFGPEVARIESPPEGVYGLVVEPVLDGSDLGSNAILRVLFDGRPIVRGPVGPRYLTSLEGGLWIAGTVTIEGGAAEWALIDLVVPGDVPPATAPAAWPIVR